MESVPCNLCGSRDSKVLFRIPDYLLGNTDELFTLVKCDQCGLVYQNPRPSKDEIGRYYPQEYEPYYQEGTDNWLMRKVNQAGVEKRCRIIYSLRGMQNGGRLLDIGCSTGLFLNRLKQTKRWEVWGVETSEYAVRIAQDQYHLQVFCGDLFQANYQDGFFDVVTLWDVLEHVPDPAKTIVEINRITKPGSYLVLRVPTLDSLDAKLFGPSWAGLDMPRHYYVFTKPNLMTLLNTHAYEIVGLNSTIGVYPTFLLSVRFWLTRRNVNMSLSQKIIRILNHPITKLLTAPFFYFYGVFQLGTEITVIARKK